MTMSAYGEPCMLPSKIGQMEAPQQTGCYHKHYIGTWLDALSPVDKRSPKRNKDGQPIVVRESDRLTNRSAFFAKEVDASKRVGKENNASAAALPACVPFVLRTTSLRTPCKLGTSYSQKQTLLC
ncbi:hypothetical protein AOLI_G00260110 [Acnodon oligacanthus]